MPPLPVVSGREALRAFQRDGRHVLRRESSHVILGKPGFSAILSIKDGYLREFLEYQESSSFLTTLLLGQ